MHPQPIPISAPLRDRFLADHVRLEALLEQLLAAFDANDREGIAALWTDFETRLEAHLGAEERLLIPALVRLSERDARVIVQEHRHIRSRLADIGTRLDLHTVRSGEIRDFIDELHAHAQSEARVLYSWADTALDEPER
jgi:hypothetical protein